MYIYVYQYQYINIYICICCMETEAQVTFLDPFHLLTIYCLYEETNGCYPFAYRLNRLNGLAHLCIKFDLKKSLNSQRDNYFIVTSTDVNISIFQARQ